MKKVAVLVIILSVMLSIVGCGNNGGDVSNNHVNNEDSDAVTLRIAWLGVDADKEKLDKTFQKFTEKTGINVETVFISGVWDEYFTKIQAMIAGGEVIDNIYVAVEGFQMFKELGLAQPLTKFIEDNQETVDELFSDVSKGVADSFVMDGEIYGFPISFNNVVMHFNMNRLAEAGLDLPDPDWGTEEFLEYCKKLTTEEDGVKKYAVSIPDGNFVMEAWLRNNGTAFMTDDFKTSLINAPETVEMFQLWQDLVHKYGYAPIPEPNVDPIQQLVDGKTAMGSWGRWPLFTYENNEFRDVGIQFLPSFKENQIQFGVDGVFVAANTEHYEEASQLTLFTSSDEFVRDYFTVGNIPARKSLAEELVPAPGYPINNEIFYNSNDNAVPVHSPVQYAATTAVVMDAYSRIVINNEDVQTTLDEAAKEMNEILSK